MIDVPIDPLAMSYSVQYRVTRRAGAIALTTRDTGVRGITILFSSGVYTCKIPDTNGDIQTLYAGVELGKKSAPLTNFF